MASLNDILTSLQQGVVAINKVVSQIATSFPPITSPSTTAPSAGTVTFSSSLATAFGTVTTSSGGTYRIALYPSS